MKDNLIQIARKGKTAVEQMNLLRNELQHLILQEVDRKLGFEKIAFLGGTALRILYGLDRFSEDLDFSVSESFHKKFELKQLAHAVSASIKSFGVDCEISKIKNIKTVHSCFFDFSGLLYEINRHFGKQQKLAIKFDVDANPPRGANEAVSPVAGARLYKVRHYDLPSLFAGKLHAILYRNYTKGRDYYDFLWYAAKKIRPNLILLENAILQTQKEPLQLTPEKLKTMLQERFIKTDFAQVKSDVSPFLFDAQSLTLLSQEVFLQAVELLSFKSTL